MARCCTPTRLRLLGTLLCLAVGASRLAAAAPTCTKALDAQQAETARYLYELRNNRQTVCSPPDFVQDPAKAGLKIQEYCSEPAATAGDTRVNVTLQFVDTCNKDKPTPLTIQALVRQCAAPGGTAQNPLLQPWQADTVKIAVQALPPNYACPAGMTNISRDTEETDFTPMWEFDHLVENAAKYKLFPEQLAGTGAGGLPVCPGGTAYLTTSMLSACFNNATGQYEGYGQIEFNECGKQRNITLFASATLLGRGSCPWPMLLNGTAPKGEQSGYDRAFDFTLGPEPAPAPTPAPSTLAACFVAAGLSVVDGSTPAALAKASQVWNKMNTTVALAVVFPTTEDQVAAAVKCCRAAGVQAVPRGGGHSYEGYSVAPGAVTISLDWMNTTTVAPDQQTATVQGGARLGQMYYAVAEQSKGGKAAVGGTCPPVGAGATLGGGLGFLSRQHGMACDSVVSARLVDAEGAILTADATQNSDLLAALCGAGNGNYGIVTQFTIKLHDVPASITLASFPGTGNEQNRLAFLKFFQGSWLKTADPRMGVQLNSGSTTQPAFVTIQFTGSKAELQALLTADGLFGGVAKVGFDVPPASVKYKEMSWIDTVVVNGGYDNVKKPADLLNIASMYKPYFKLKSYLAMQELPDAAWKAIMDFVGKSFQYGGYVEMDMIGGKSAVAAVPANATGFVHRTALFSIQYGAEWDRESETANILPYINELQQALMPFFAPEQPAFINYLDVAVSSDPMVSYWGANAGWLQAVKQKYDPSGFWSTNPLSIRGSTTALPGSSPAPAPTSSPAAAGTAPAPAATPAPATSAASCSMLRALAAAASALLGAALLL